LKNLGKRLEIFSRKSNGIRQPNRNVEIVEGGIFNRRMAEQPSDSHADLERKVAEKTRDLSALYALTSPISQASELTGVLDDAVIKIIDVTGADAASIRLSDERDDRLILTSHHGFPEDYTREFSIETGQGKIGRQILRTGESIISEELVDDSKFHRGLLARHGFRSAAYLPLKASQKKGLGMIVLASREPGRLSSRQSELFTAIAHQIAVALENARLFQEKERRAREQHALRELLANLLLLDLDELLQRMTEQAAMLFQADFS
jgi:GAF domain-containing protein